MRLATLALALAFTGGPTFTAQAAQPDAKHQAKAAKPKKVKSAVNTAQLKRFQKAHAMPVRKSSVKPVKHANQKPIKPAKHKPVKVTRHNA